MAENLSDSVLQNRKKHQQDVELRRRGEFKEKLHSLIVNVETLMRVCTAQTDDAYDRKLRIPIRAVKVLSIALQCWHKLVRIDQEGYFVRGKDALRLERLFRNLTVQHDKSPDPVKEQINYAVVGFEVWRKTIKEKENAA